MNNKVTVTGMTVTTKVSDNLYITGDTFDSTATITADSSYKNSHVQKQSAILEPVSTVNGQNFFYTATTNALASGDAASDAYITYDLTAVDNKGSFANNFENNYAQASAVGYIEYVFQLKAINTAAAAKNLGLTQLKLTYAGTTDPSRAYRVVMFVENLDTVNNSTNVTSAQAPLGNYTGFDKTVIYTPSGAANFTANNAVASTTALGSVTYNSAAASSLWEVPANTTAYYKVVVRLWLEGEDNTCNNTTFAKLTDKWALDLSFELGTSITGVDYIELATTASKVDLTSDTVSSDAVTINEVTYKKLTTNNTYYIDTASLTAASHVFQIIDGRPIDVTYACILPSA